jgi:hypothetical protein
MANKKHVKTLEKAAEAVAKNGANMKDKIAKELNLDSPFHNEH